MRTQFTANLEYLNTDVSIFIAKKNIAATIYTVATGGTAIDTLPQVNTDSSGLLSFYVDTVDYDLDQLFDIKIGKVDISYNFILSNISIFNVKDYADTKQASNLKNVANGYTGRDADNDATTATDVADYGGAFASYIPPTGSKGAIRIAIDTNATTPGKRLYAFANSAWSSVTLT